MVTLSPERAAVEGAGAGAEGRDTGLGEVVGAED